jgi:hypothetical protein
VAADIAFPDNYNSSTPDFLVAIDDDGPLAVPVGGNGGIYRIIGAVPTKFGNTANAVAVDFVSIDVVGNTGTYTAMAGTTAATAASGTDGGMVYYSTDGGGTSWTTTTATKGKEPSGEGNCYVVMDTATTAWAATSGVDAAVSLTKDGGILWNQISLIDSDITTVDDIAFGGSMYVVGTDAAGAESVWKDDGTNWERVYTGMGACRGLVELSPDYATTNTVFIATLGGTAIRKSTGGGATFTAQPTAVPAAITAWAVIDGNNLITGDAAANLYKTSNNGLSWTTLATGAGEDIASIALSPNYATDSTIIIGTDGSVGTGDVWISSDAGVTWLSTAVSNAGMTDVQRVAFDPDYANNATIYTTDDTSGGIYRCVYGTSITWDQLDVAGSLVDATADVTLGTGIALSADGTLYVADGDTTVSEMVSRCLSPTSPLAPVNYVSIENANDTATATVSATVGATGVWVTTDGTDNKLWTIDTAASPDAVYHYTDTLAKELVLDQPLDATNLGAATWTSLSWEALAGATGYTAVVNTRSDFLAAFAGTVTQVDPEVTATVTGLSAGTTYYWRVRADVPVLSRYSETRTFITQLGTPGAPATLAPANGAQAIILKPSFGWGAVTYATSYEVELTKDPAFESGIMKRTSPTNALAWDTPLDYSTTYYWRVRALTATGQSPWVVGVFTTMDEPTPPVVVEPTPPAPAAPEITLEVPAPQVTEVTIPPAPAPEYIVPGYIYAIIAIGAVLVIAVIVLIVRTRRVP